MINLGDVKMLKFPNVTQDYLISTIFPGLFNSLVIYYSIRQTFCPQYSITDPYSWVFYFLFAIIMTLIVGIRVEHLIYCIIASICNKDLPKDYDDFDSWRADICKLSKRSEAFDRAYAIISIERIMYEYYCINNIIPAMIISVFMLGSYILFNFILYNILCMIQLAFFIADVIFLICVYFVMRKWLKDGVKLRGLLSSDDIMQLFE